MMIEHSRRIQRGFSLHEAMISLAVLSSGLLTLAQFQGQLHENSAQTKAQTTAVNLAQQKLEALRAQANAAYASIAEGSDSPPMQAGDNARFNRHWTVTHHTSPAPDYKAVSVTTEWQSSDGTTQSISIASFLTSGTPYRSRPDTDAAHAAEEQTAASDQDSDTPNDG